MNRTEKETTVKSLSEKVKGTKAFVLADYCGLTVKQLTDLRKKLRQSKSSFSIIKNRLFKRALNDLSIKGLEDFIKGPTAIAMSNDDPVLQAKTLVDFAKDNEKLKVKVGFMDAKVLTFAMIGELAKLPSREVLLSRLLGSMNAPASNMVFVLAAIPRKLVTALNAIKEKKQ